MKTELDGAESKEDKMVVVPNLSQTQPQSYMGPSTSQHFLHTAPSSGATDSGSGRPVSATEETTEVSTPPSGIIYKYLLLPVLT